MQFFKVLFIAAISAVVVADTSSCASNYADCIDGACCDGWHCTGNDGGWFVGVCIRDDYNVCKNGGC